MPNIHTYEYEWQVEIDPNKSFPKIICYKNIEFKDKNEKLLTAFRIQFTIIKNTMNDIVNQNLSSQTSMLKKIQSVFNSKEEVKNLSYFNVYTHFCIYFTDCIKDAGNAKVILHNIYDNKIEELYRYSYANETDPMIIFDTQNRFAARKIFKAFFNDIITKIEFNPTEKNTFERVYFNLSGDDSYLLSEKINNALLHFNLQLKI